MINIDLEKKDIVLTILIFLVLFTINIYAIHSYDVFWHLETGGYIVENNTIPTEDVFSWYGIENNLEWIHHSWLFGVMLYFVYDVLGYWGIIFFRTFLLFGLLVLIYLIVHKKTKKHFFSLILTFIINFFIITMFISVRPFLFSYFILLAIVLLLEKEKFWWVIPLVLLGVNIHGGFYPMYIMIITIYTYKKKPIIIPITLCTLLINPHIFDMLLYPFIVQGYEHIRYIREWRITNILDKNFLFPIITYATLLFSIKKVKLKKEEIVLFVLVILQSLSAIRHLIFLYILLVPLFSNYIYIMLCYWKEKYEKKYRKGATINFLTSKNKIFLIVYFSLFFVYQVAMIPSTPLNIEDYPSNEVVSYIKENNLERILNSYKWGGYLIHKDIKPMIDGRADMYQNLYNDNDLFLEYVHTVRGVQDARDFVSKYKVKYIFLDKNSDYIFNAILKHDNCFKSIYNDERYIIYQVLDELIS